MTQKHMESLQLVDYIEALRRRNYDIMNKTAGKI
jgi:hypothetical protein